MVGVESVRRGGSGCDTMTYPLLHVYGVVLLCMYCVVTRRNLVCLRRCLDE